MTRYKKGGTPHLTPQTELKGLWNFDHTIAEYILPRLIEFKKHDIGHPPELTMDDWYKILDKMIYSFKAILDEWNTDKDVDEVGIQEGLDLFGKYFRSLWW